MINVIANNSQAVELFRQYQLSKTSAVKKNAYKHTVTREQNCQIVSDRLKIFLYMYFKISVCYINLCTVMCFNGSLQPYSYSNFGGVMIPQMPMNYAQNVYAYQVHAHTHTPISQKHPVVGLQGSAHMLLHMKWRPQPGWGPSVPGYPHTLHPPHPSLCYKWAWIWLLPSAWPLTPLPPHAVCSTSLDSRPEDTGCQSGDSAFTRNKSRCQCFNVSKQL